MSNSKLVGVKREDYDGGYTVWTFLSETGTSHVVQRDCGDYYEVTPLKSLDFDKPFIVGTPAGDIPDEVKSEFKNGIRFKVRNTTLKFPKLPGDLTEREKVWDEIHAEGLKKMESDYKQAFDKALTRAKQEVALLAIRNVNLDCDTSPGELNKDINMVEKGIGSSSDEIMEDSVVDVLHCRL